jgi:hypothetical protein
MSINPNLKRHRSTSQPPSPSGSSPKRAASEDDFADTDSTPVAHASSATATATASSLLGLNMHTGPAVGSSPLRNGTEGDESSWVKRTEDVHLSPEADITDMDVEERPDSAGQEEEADRLRKQYDVVLSEPWSLLTRGVC